MSHTDEQPHGMSWEREAQLEQLRKLTPEQKDTALFFLWHTLAGVERLKDGGHARATITLDALHHHLTTPTALKLHNP